MMWRTHKGWMEMYASMNSHIKAKASSLKSVLSGPKITSLSPPIRHTSAIGTMANVHFMMCSVSNQPTPENIMFGSVSDTNMR